MVHLLTIICLTPEWSYVRIKVIDEIKGNSKQRWQDQENL